LGVTADRGAVALAVGNPYGTSRVDGAGTNPANDTTRAAARVQAERVVRIAAAVKHGLAAA
jgi:NAD(P)H dehydrogenase (quinone)